MTFRSVTTPENHTEYEWIDQWPNEGTGTFYFPFFLIESIIDEIGSPRSKKLWITKAYCDHWICIEQADYFIWHYALESV